MRELGAEPGAGELATSAHPDVIGACVRADGTVVGRVSAVLVDPALERVLGLEIVGERRLFLPWIAASVRGGEVRAVSRLVLFDGDQVDGFARRGARLVHDRDEIARIAERARNAPVNGRFGLRPGGYSDAVSGAGSGELGVDQTAPVEVDLHLAPGESLEPVGRLVAAGVAGRLGLPVDRVLRLERAVDSILCGPGAERASTVRLTETDAVLAVALGPLDAHRVEASALEHVLSRLVDSVTTRPSGPHEVWVDLRLSLDELPAASTCPS